MLDAFQVLLPYPLPVHHLGIYRKPSTLQPVEYHNNLPYHRPGRKASRSNTEAEEKDGNDGGRDTGVLALSILLNPVNATGETSYAPVQTLWEWDVKKVVVVSITGNVEGVKRAARMKSEGERGNKEAEVWIKAVDEGLDDKGMIRPGLGDVGDRLLRKLRK